MSTLSVSKLRAFASAAVLGVVAVGSAPFAHAQGQEVKVTVPFAFENGSQHLPPGRYSLRTDAQHLMHIQGASTGGLSIVMPQEGFRPASVSKVVFHRCGDRYFLREVWIAGQATHLQTPISRSEKRLLIASKNVAPNGNEVALLENPR